MNKGRTLNLLYRLVRLGFGRDIMELLNEKERNVNRLPRIGLIILILLLFEPIMIKILPPDSLSSKLKMYFGLIAGIGVMTFVFLVNQDILPKRLIGFSEIITAVILTCIGLIYIGDSYVQFTIGQQEPELFFSTLGERSALLIMGIRIFFYSTAILLIGLQLSRLTRWGLTKSETSSDSVKREILLWSRTVEGLLAQEPISAGNSQRLEKQFLKQIKTQFDLKIESRNIQEDLNQRGNWFPLIMEEMYTEIYNDFATLYNWPIKSVESSVWKSWEEFVKQKKVEQYVRENYNRFCIDFIFEPERGSISSNYFWKVMLMLDNIDSVDEVREGIRDQFSLVSRYLNEHSESGSDDQFKKKSLLFMQTIYAEYSIKKSRPLLDMSKNLIRKSMVVNVIDLLEESKEYGWKSHRRAAMESFSQGGLEFSWSHDTVCNPTIQDLIRRQLLYNEGNLFLPREESEGFLNSNEQVHHQFVQELINRKKQTRQI